MSASRGAAVLLAAAVVGIAAGGCTRALFQRPGPPVEHISSHIPGGRFHVIATIAGSDSRIGFQVSVTVRQQLEDSGFTVVRRAGRWGTELSAVQAICAPESVPIVDGVLFIWYNRLVLRDCATAGIAYEIALPAEGGLSIGIVDLTNSLVGYVRAGRAAPAPDPEGAAAPPPEEEAPAPSGR